MYRDSTSFWDVSHLNAPARSTDVPATRPDEFNMSGKPHRFMPFPFEIRSRTMVTIVGSGAELKGTQQSMWH